MSGPANINPRQLVASIDELMRGGGGWEDIERLAPELLQDPHRPGDAVMRLLGALSQTEDGRQVVDWIFDMTIRARYPHVGNDFQAAALNAARYEGRAAIGEVILAAIVEGRKLLDQAQGATS